MIIFILFIALCGSSIFANFHGVNDAPIVSKWLFAVMGAGVCLFAIGLKWLGRSSWQNKSLGLPLLYSSVLLLGCIQAVLGILQAVGVCHSESSYTVVGSFDNPAGFAACLCAAMPLAYPSMKSSRKRIRWMAYGAVILLSVAVCLSQSRAGMVSLLAVATVVAYAYLPKLKHRKTVAAFLFILLVGASYFWKKDSADGRILVWQCTCEMIKERPLTGWGMDAFTAHYMDYQAAYFRENPQSRFAWLADNVNRPFNEYLKVCLMGGIPALLLVVSMSVFLFYCYRRNLSCEGKAALLSLVSIGALSFFSYPFEYPFTWIMVFFCCYILVRQVHWDIKIAPWLRRSGAVCLMCLAIYGLYNCTQRIQAELEWKRISDLALRGKGAEVFPRYEELKQQLGDNLFFLYNYAAELYVAEEYERCLPLLEECRERWADYDVEFLLGETYMQLGRNGEAIPHFQLAVEMCPVKFMPLYKLHLCHKSIGNKEEAQRLARIIVNKKVKVPSAEIRRIKAKMKAELLQ